MWQGTMQNRTRGFIMSNIVHIKIRKTDVNNGCKQTSWFNGTE